LNILINLALMLGLILAVMMLPLLYWRGFRARPGTTLFVTMLSLFVLIGAAINFDRLFAGCRTSGPPNAPHFHYYGMRCGQP